MITPDDATQLDKVHPLLKYVLGTKGISRVHKGWVCTCVCKSYTIVPTEEEAAVWYKHHEECKQYDF